MNQTFIPLLTTEELGRLTHRTAKDVESDFQPDEVRKLPGGKTCIVPKAVRTFLARRGVSFDGKVVAHINLKGGTGKTTSTITAATRAVQYGFRTCILDLDSQASASVAFNAIAKEGEDAIFYDIWQKPEDLLPGALKQLEERLFILPSSLDNSLLDVHLVHPASQKRAVRSVCDVLKAQGFDLIVIDCPPSLSAVVISTICAADMVVIPVCADIFSRKGLELTLNELASLCDTFQIAPPVIKILYTKFDRRINVSIKTYRLLKEMYEDNLIPNPIRISSEFSKALEQHTTIFSSGRWNQAKADYDAYVRHILHLSKS